MGGCESERRRLRKHSHEIAVEIDMDPLQFMVYEDFRQKNIYGVLTHIVYKKVNNIYF